MLRRRAPQPADTRRGVPGVRGIPRGSAVIDVNAVIAVTLGIGMGMLAACASPTSAPTPVPVAQSLPVPTYDPAPRTDSGIGVQVFEAEVETDALEQLRGAGVSWSRTRALWKLIEPAETTPPTYDLTVTDWLFGDTTAAGFRNVASVYANPPWAAATECGPVFDGKIDRYAALWTALVERYDGDGVDDAPNGAMVALLAGVERGRLRPDRGFRRGRLRRLFRRRSGDVCRPRRGGVPGGEAGRPERANRLRSGCATTGSPPRRRPKGGRHRRVRSAGTSRLSRSSTSTAPTPVTPTYRSSTS